MRSLAKRLVSPDLVCPDHYSGPDWILTDGPAVAEINAKVNFAPDPQQELGLDLLFAVGANGLPACFAFCVVCARQNLKTGLFKQAAIGWLYVTQERRIIWSAHELDTTREAQKELEELITEAPMLSRHLAGGRANGMYDANGQARIELADGRMIKFKARTLSGGRGLAGDKVVLDEAFALRPSHVGSLIPTMTARPGGQVVYGSSAGKADSTILRDVRDRGRKGSSPRLFYLEWGGATRPCGDPECTHPKDAEQRGMDCALDDRELWLRNNPTISTGRISLQTIADIRQELPPEEFARESMGLWEDPGDLADSIFPTWPDCAVEEAVELPAVKVLGVAVSVDQAWTSLVSSGLWADETVHIDVVDRRPDSDWVPAEVKRIQVAHRCVVAIDEKCPDPDLITRLKEEGVRLTVLKLDDIVEGTSDFKSRTKHQTITHMDYPELDDAIRAAGWRDVGDGRVVVGRRKSDGDVDTLEGAIVALRGLRKQGRKPMASFV